MTLKGLTTALRRAHYRTQPVLTGALATGLTAALWFTGSAGAQEIDVPLPMTAVTAPSPEAPQSVSEQPASAEVAETLAPFVGAVIGTKVNVRSGPSTSYEVMTQVVDRERVVVTGETLGWYQVTMQHDVPVFVHKDLLERRGQGVALIARDRVNVRARPHLGASVVGQLGRGDLLSVRGQEGDWVELAAPSTIPFFVHRDFVRRTGEAPPVGAPRVLLPEPPVERAASAPITEREEAVTAPPVPVAPDAKEMLIEARDRYLAELEKQDLSAMDFGSALGRYEEALEIAEHPVVREAAQAGVRRVQLAIKLQRDHRAQMEALDRALGE